MSKALSVIVPVHNRSGPLRRALSSLSAQTDQDFEVIVVDDGSTENIEAIVQAFPQLDIQFRKIPASGAPARPRNVAIALASSPWLAFLDSDDWWTPTKVHDVKTQLAGSDIVYHKLKVVHTSHRRHATQRPYVGRRYRTPVINDMISRGNPFAMSGTVVRRQLVLSSGGMWEAASGDAIDDFDLWLRLAYDPDVRISYIDRALGYYEVSDDNISATSVKQYIRHRRLYQRHLRLMPPGFRPFARAHFEYTLGSFALRLGLTRRALLHFTRVDPRISRKKFIYGLMKYILHRFGRGLFLAKA